MGYGGTAQEMYRLLERAAELDEEFAKTAEFSIDSKGHLTAEFADITQAIHIVQTEMGITGTTALEAGRTISGSAGAMKSAWSNLVTGLANGNADVGKLVDNLVTTIVGDGTESNLGVLGNVMPAVKTALTGASKLVGELLPEIVQEIPEIINDNLPILAEAAIAIVQSLADGISDNQEVLIETAFETIVFLANSLISMFPQIVALGLDLIVSLANGIAESLPELIPTIIDVVLKIVEILTNQETLTELLGAAFTIVTELAWGLVENIDKLIDAVFLLIDGMIDFLLRPENLAMLIETAIELVVAIGTGIVKAIPRLLVSLGSLINSIFANFATADWKSIGTNIVDGLKNGISKAWENLKNWFKNLFGDLGDIAKKILGIASPSKVFKKIGGFTAEGFGVGFEDEFDRVKKDMERAMTFDDVFVGINSSIKRADASGLYGANMGGVSIVQNIYSEAKTAADLMQEALYLQERAVMLGV